MLRELWATFDDDGSGILERSEVSHVIEAALDRQATQEELDKAFAEMDVDGSGEIDFNEFSEWWNKQSGIARDRAQRKNKQRRENKGDGNKEPEPEPEPQQAAPLARTMSGRISLGKAPAKEERKTKVAIKLRIDICKAELMDARASGDTLILQAALAAARDLGQKKDVPELLELANMIEKEEEESNPKLRLKKKAQQAPEVQRIVRLLWDLVAVESARCEKLKIVSHEVN